MEDPAMQRAAGPAVLTVLALSIAVNPLVGVVVGTVVFTVLYMKYTA